MKYKIIVWVGGAHVGVGLFCHLKIFELLSHLPEQKIGPVPVFLFFHLRNEGLQLFRRFSPPIVCRVQLRQYHRSFRPPSLVPVIHQVHFRLQKFNALSYRFHVKINPAFPKNRGLTSFTITQIL